MIIWLSGGDGSPCRDDRPQALPGGPAQHVVELLEAADANRVAIVSALHLAAIVLIVGAGVLRRPVVPVQHHEAHNVGTRQQPLEQAVGVDARIRVHGVELEEEVKTTQVRRLAIGQRDVGAADGEAVGPAGGHVCCASDATGALSYCPYLFKPG